MATVLEDYATEEQRSVVRFLCSKGLNARGIHKEMFLFTGGKCLSLKAVHNWVEKRSKFLTITKKLKRCAEVTKTAVKTLLCCGCRRTGKAMGQMYRCWWRICREINIFSSFEYPMFYILYPFVAYLLTLPRILHCIKKG
jgi:hypothetical protein